VLAALNAQRPEALPRLGASQDGEEG